MVSTSIKQDGAYYGLIVHQALMWLAETLAVIRSRNEVVHLRGDLADWKYDPHAKVRCI